MAAWFRPGVLVTELLAYDGPHVAEATAWAAGAACLFCVADCTDPMRRAWGYDPVVCIDCAARMENPQQ